MTRLFHMHWMNNLLEIQSAMRKKDRPNSKEHYYPYGIKRFVLLLKMFWVVFLWHKDNQYSYCDGWNWATCKSLNNKDCPFIKYNLHCSHNIPLYDPNFDSKEAWDKWEKLQNSNKASEANPD